MTHEHQDRQQPDENESHPQNEHYEHHERGSDLYRAVGGGGRPKQPMPPPASLAAVVVLSAAIGAVVTLGFVGKRPSGAAAQPPGRPEQQQHAADNGGKSAALSVEEAQKRIDEARTRADFALQKQQELQDRDDATQRRLYVTQVRLAKQAWDRGDTSLVNQLLEPYRTDKTKQKFRSFACDYLWSATHTVGNTPLRGHVDAVRAVVFTADGAGALTLGDDATLVFWDTANGAKVQNVALEGTVRPLSLYAAEEEQLSRQAGGLAVNSDGLWAAAYGKSISIGTCKRPEQVRRIEDHQSPIISLAMSRDGQFLATGDYQGEIIVHSLPDGKVIQRWIQVRPQALAFGSDGRRLVGGTHDGGAFIWDVASGKLLISATFGQPITSLVVSPDGQTVAVALADRDGVVRLWEPSAGRIRAELRGHTDQVLQVAFAPDSRTLVTASRDQTARMWNTSGSPLKVFRGHLGAVHAAAFSPDGRRIITGGADRTAILWNVDGGQQGEALSDTPPFGYVSGLNFTPSDRQLVGTGSCESSEAFLGTWDLALSNKPIPVQTTSKSGTSLGFSPDGKYMATGEAASLNPTSKSRVRVWNMESGRVTASLAGLVGPINSAVYSSNNRYLAVALGDPDEKSPGVVKLLEAATCTLRQTLPNMAGRTEALFTPDARTLVTVTGSKRRPGDIQLWDPAGGASLGRIDKAKDLEFLTAAAMSPDGQWLVTGHGDLANPTDRDKAKIKVWDLSRRDLVAQFPAVHAAAVTTLAFSRRGVLLASGDTSGVVVLWDFATRKPLPKQLASQGRAIVSMAFDRLGERIATAAQEKCIRLWHVDTGAAKAILELAEGAPAVVRYTPDGKTLVASTSAGGLFLWDADTYRPKAVFRAEGNPAGENGHAGVITCSVPLGADGKLLTGSSDKTIKLWDMRTRTFLQTVISGNQIVSSLAVSPDGSRLIVGTGRFRKTFEPGELIHCDLSQGFNRPATQPLLKGIAVTATVFTPDGGSLVYCGLTSDASHGMRREGGVINLVSGKLSPLAAPDPLSLAVAPDGRLLAVGRADGDVDLWPIDAAGSLGKKPLVLHGHVGAVAALAFSPDGKTLVSGGYDNNAKLWDVATGEDLLTLKHDGAVEAVRFSSDGRILATADRQQVTGGVRLWRAAGDDR
jgi:WD40 repeat protein